MARRAAAADYWPADFHVIGKDILVPPHAVYWPIMLHAAGIALPKALLVHGWWLLKGGQKMSKSTGNVVNPLDLVERFGVDAFRYFLIREMNVGQDSEFSLELFLSRYNSDLANDLGNLVNRALNMTGRFAGGSVPAAGTGRGAGARAAGAVEPPARREPRAVRRIPVPPGARPRVHLHQGDQRLH